MADNPRFADYATSGAFAVGLTRVQIAGLAMVLGMGGQCYTSAGALERKGLIETIRDGSPDPHGNGMEYRLTQAGALVLELCRLAGLTNIPVDAIGAEIEGLRSDLDEARGTMREACTRARSILARFEESERELVEARRVIERQRLALEQGIRLKESPRAYERPVITLRDPLPDMSTTDVVAGLPE